MDIESVVLVISVILLFVIGYVAVGVLPRSEEDQKAQKQTQKVKNTPHGK